MTAKELLLDNKPLAETWRATAHSMDTARVLAFAWSQWIHSAHPTSEQIQGAKGFEHTLLSICDKEPELEELPNIGLRHDIDDPRSEKDQQQPETNPAS